MEVRKIGIILKQGSEQPKKICHDLQAFLSERHIAAQVDKVSDDCNMLIILGGDGTLLHVAYQASLLQIPVIGINLGGLGFLTEVSVEELYETLQLVFSDYARIEKRMMIRTRIQRSTGSTPWHVALNDVVISKGAADRLIRLGAWADKEFITAYRADGLIFSTATGSTAYNLSAGGPIVHPMLQSIIVTPICPFMLESRPVLLPAGVVVTTRMLSPGSTPVQVIVDGRQTWEMGEQDVLEVMAAAQPLLLLCSPKKSYFEILRNKLNWGGGKSKGAVHGSGAEAGSEV